MSELTDKQKLFVQEYLVDLNATQAAIRAGYSDKTAYSIGNENLSKPEIAEAIAKAQEERAARTEITADRVLAELAKVGFSDPRAVMSWTSAGVSLRPSADLSDAEASIISEVSETKDGFRVKLHSKLDALGKIGQHLGMFKERIEHTGRDGGPIETVDLSDTEAARRIAFTLAKATQPTTH